MMQGSRFAWTEEVPAPKILTVFIQERLVSIIENDGCETDRKCEVYGSVKEDYNFS